MKFNQGVAEEEIGFQMAPMIDVVFQLIIFFMCVTQLNKLEVAEGIKLPVADHAIEKKGVNEVIVNVYKDGTIFITPNKYEMEELPGYISSVRGDGDLKVYIRGDEETDFDRILKVMTACAKAGVWDVNFAAYQERKE